MTDINTLHGRTYEWGIRRKSGTITMSSQGWAADIHTLTGLPVVRWTGSTWEDA